MEKVAVKEKRVRGIYVLIQILHITEQDITFQGQLYYSIVHYLQYIHITY